MDVCWLYWAVRWISLNLLWVGERGLAINIEFYVNVERIMFSL